MLADCLCPKDTVAWDWETWKLCFLGHTHPEWTFCHTEMSEDRESYRLWLRNHRLLLFLPRFNRKLLYVLGRNFRGFYECSFWNIILTNYGCFPGKQVYGVSHATILEMDLSLYIETECHCYYFLTLPVFIWMYHFPSQLLSSISLFLQTLFYIYFSASLLMTNILFFLCLKWFYVIIFCSVF